MRVYLALAMSVASTVTWAQSEPIAQVRLLRTDDLSVEVEPEVLQRQYNTLRAMNLETLDYSPRGPVSNLVGVTGIVLPSNVSTREKGDSATDLLLLFKDVLLANGSESLTVSEKYVVHGSQHALVLTQSIGGIPVIDGLVSIAYDRESRLVTGVTAHFVPDRDLPRAPKYSAERSAELLRSALDYTKESSAHFYEGATLGYYSDFADPSPPQLVWAMRAVNEHFDDIFLVDSMTGLVSARRSMRFELSRKVYDMNNSVLASFPQGLPGELTLNQINSQTYRSTPYNDLVDVDNILHNRVPDLIGSFPSTIHLVVRYGLNGPNFYWPTTTKDYIALTGTSGSHTHGGFDKDTVAHEYAHSVGVRVFGTTGSQIDVRAMHESFADVAATVVDIARYGETTSTWILGEDYYNDGRGWASLRAPFNDPQSRLPAADWYEHRGLWAFAVDVNHYNAGITNLAYYLMAKGGQHPRYTEPDIPDTVLTPLGEATARDIYFNAFRNVSMDSNPTIPKLKGAAMAYASAAYNTATRTKVKNAFETVGVCETATVAPPIPSISDIGDFFCDGWFKPVWDIVTGATRYYMEVAPANLGWAFAVPASDVDGSTNHCMIQVPQDSFMRMRACNDCGCSDWSQQQYLDFLPECL